MRTFYLQLNVALYIRGNDRNSQEYDADLYTTGQLNQYWFNSHELVLIEHIKVTDELIGVVKEETSHFMFFRITILGYLYIWTLICLSYVYIYLEFYFCFGFYFMHLSIILLIHIFHLF